MGQGGQVVLNNQTQHDIKLEGSSKYQMNSWLPSSDVIPAGISHSWYVEWDQGITTTEGDDSGEAHFRFVNTELTFQIQARGSPGGFHIQALMEFYGGNFGNGAVFNAGWNHDGRTVFFLTESNGKFHISI